MTLIITAIVASFVTGFFVYKYLYPQIQRVKELDKETEKQNQELQERYEKLTKLCSDLQGESDELKEQNNDAKLKIAQSSVKQQTLLENITSLTSQLSTAQNQLDKALQEQKQIAEKAAQSFYDDKLKEASTKFGEALIKESENYQALVEEFKQNYSEIVETQLAETENIKQNIARLTAINAALIEEAKRKEEMETKQDFYRIQLSEIDKEEITKLRAVAPYLRNAEPLNKVIWKTYYEKPTNDLVGRVIGPGAHIGIYKITEISTGKTYVGQSLDLTSRWKQHIKRGLGAETPTRNKLYPAMQAAGPENFTFEVLEECKREDLDEREDFYQETFHSIDYGFSIK